MTSAFRDHSVSVRSLADPSVSLEAEERAGVCLTQRAPDWWESARFQAAFLA
jgi:hypothetical protein